MADSFADLWSSLEPTKQNTKPSTLGAASKLQTSATASQARANDAFSILASASASSSRTASRSLTPSLQPQRPQSSQAQSNLAQKPSSNSNNGDAFGSLLSASFSSGKSGNLSLAERQAAAVKEQQARLEREKLDKAKEADAWSGLDLLGQDKSKGTPSASAANDWIFDEVPRPSSSSYSTAPDSTLVPENAKGSSAAGSVSYRQPQAQRPAVPTTSTTSLFDILSDDFSPTALPPSYTPNSNTNVENGRRSVNGRDAQSAAFRRRPDSPGDFDFGDREDRLLHGSDDSASEGEGGDDILGILSKPVDSIPKRRISPTHNPSPALPPQAAKRVNSPPPHIIGQIVEMGFSPDQALLALAATDSGVDVEQALEMLLSNGAGSTNGEDARIVDERPESRSRIRYGDDEDPDLGSRAPQTRRNQRPPMRRQASGSARSQPEPQASSSIVPGDLQERADKLISQASEIGLSVFTRANAFWKEGKERVQKVYEERASSGQGGAKVRAPVDGRPKWMTDVRVVDGEHDEHGSAVRGANGSFRDDDEVVNGAFSQDGVRGNDLRKGVDPRGNGSASGSASRQPRTANLFDDEPVSYVSPSRRRNGAPRTPAQSNLSSTLSAPKPVSRSPSPEPLRIRDTVSASTSTIALSNKHKAKGTELYKLGQYAEAEKAYTSALETLPAKHLLLIPLHNNRAVSRLKTGDHAGAIEDCTSVLTLVGPAYHPAKEAKVSKEEEGSSVDIADAVLKAYRRRAEAYEGREKWASAQKDWEAIIACDWSTKARADALNGISRCKKMVSSESEPIAARPAPKPRQATTSAPRRTSPPQTFEAVQKLREANKALEAEDSQKLALKDSVDARLLAWRGGKETNLRALLASLEVVLWPELGWQKVGMHELVSPGQVKVRYMKAIAKLHPDKLAVANTTLEHRMIANGVFAALNDAWLAFKQ